MNTMNEQCIYVCGPYKDYCGRAEYDDDAGIFHGDVIGTQDVVTFQGKDLPQLRKAFCDSVDDYLSLCKETGQPPEKPFSGKFVTRVEPALHRKVSMLAQSLGLSLNQLVCNCLETMTQGEASTPPICDPPVIQNRNQRHKATTRGSAIKKGKRHSASKPASKRRHKEYA